MTVEVTVDDGTAGIPAFPMQRTCPFHPAPGYGHLRESDPVSRVTMPTGETVWMITGFEYARQILTDPRVSAERSHAGFPVLPGFPSREVMLAVLERSMIGMDAPDHTVQRRMLLSEFTVKQTQKMVPRIREIVDQCITDMVNGPRPTDLMQSLAVPVPTYVIGELLGIPNEDYGFFQELTGMMLKRGTPGEAKRAAAAELKAYIGRLVAAADENPGDDLLGRLAVKFREAGSDHQQLIRMVMLLLSGGHETSANMIALTVVALLENPEQLAAVKADPALTMAAVDEALRYFSVAAEVTGYRAALEDIEIGGRTIRAGEGIIALGSAANRDPEAFPDPDAFDIHRRSRHHLAFGYGMHQCIGQNVARVELEIIIRTLFERLPDLRLAKPVSELPWKNDSSIYGIYEVPVTW